MGVIGLTRATSFCGDKTCKNNAILYLPWCKLMKNEPATHWKSLKYIFFHFLSFWLSLHSSFLLSFFIMFFHLHFLSFSLSFYFTFFSFVHCFHLFIFVVMFYWFFHLYFYLFFHLFFFFYFFHFFHFICVLSAVFISFKSVSHPFCNHLFHLMFYLSQFCCVHYYFCIDVSNMYIRMAFPTKPTKHYPPNNGEWKKHEEVITVWRLHWLKKNEKNKKTKKMKKMKKMKKWKKWKKWKNEKNLGFFFFIFWIFLIFLKNYSKSSSFWPPWGSLLP